MTTNTTLYLINQPVREKGIVVARAELDNGEVRYFSGLSSTVVQRIALQSIFRVGNADAAAAVLL